ncbi:RsmB/NOP family class I SAM-dependent RNA methyltransferase [Maritimibacter sp. HL-12]|uniref:RsmB/NOP family class I SAM-dependent RNA methyltransferase n=1 Tax=Maritimibacter sp. HL-12 TaxID=1162418 RepID=UPI000A0F20BD|nr:RsmB/NOP family class I SAM-dependent RNA methyltransferase [Maritimibacter sp. HL-12]SMH58319.1 16S rRNA (cytosine967-C5)-methyltransferase [Maritimibacter sp. HL-12]
MTPAARIAAAIEVLDSWLEGAPLERALTNWARGHRFAGSKDRAAIRDHVFESVRCRRSHAALGGGESGRGLMIGALKARDEDPNAWFTGEGHAPEPLAPGEGEGPGLADLPEAVRLDCPDWLVPPLRASLGEDFAPAMAALRHRAPVFLRVNLARITLEAARAALAGEGIAARPHPLSPGALEVVEGARKVQASAAYRDGLVELQDAASQAVVDLLPVAAGSRVLDYCAGGGGKSLALAARGAAVTAHDIDAGRMRDLPARAARAGAKVAMLPPGARQADWGFDLVLADAPCSGSGAWRRNPQGKWDLTPDRLDELCDIQAGILDEIRDFVAPGGWLAYATCSLIEAENTAQITGFLARHPDWRCTLSRRFTPLDGGDGFFLALLTR